MDLTLSKLDAPRRLAELLDKGRAWPVADGLLLVQRLAVAVEALHRSGRTHRAIHAGEVLVYHGLRPELTPPPSQRCFGVEFSDPDHCPPELAGADALTLPADLQEASALLAKQGYAFDPRWLDIYQLGALLCRLLTGESVRAYMYEPKGKRRVPPVARSILERSLGHDPAARFTDCGLLIAALGEAIEQVSPASDSLATRETPQSGSAAGLLADTPGGVGQRPQAGPAPAALGRSSQPAAAPELKRLGHYRILSAIGRGGMGDVYRGYDESLDREVAIKVLPAELAREQDFVRRFHAEATAAAKIAHPNVVPVYFSGEDSGHHFFAMQFVEGESLAQRLFRRRQLPVEEALAILRQCLAGLEAAHNQGLIHRDVKPGNILLEHRTGRAMLVDFGLVRRIGQGEGLTVTGMIMGTVDYLAPEQARGLPVDGRTDLYALGVLAYQMLAGRLPFQAETPTAMMFQHAYEEPPPLREVAPQVPPAVEAVVARMMAKDPADRCQTAREVLDDLDALGRLAEKPAAAAAPAAERSSRQAAFAPPEAAAELQAAARRRAFDRLRGWGASIFHRHAPQFIQDLQSTAQQLDGAVAEYQRRRDRLARLHEEAGRVAADLAAELGRSVRAAAAAQQRVESAPTEEQEQAAVREKGRLDEQVASMRVECQQQQERFEELQLQLSKVDATLAQLCSQRDALEARWRAACCAGGQEASRFRARRFRVLLPAAIAAGLVLAACLLWFLVRGSHEPSSQPHASPEPPAVEAVAAASAPPAISAPSLDPETAMAHVTNPLDAPQPQPVSATAASPLSALPLIDETRSEVCRFSDMGWAVKSLAFSPDGRFLAAGKMDRALLLFDLVKKQRVTSLADLEGLGQVTALSFSPDGRMLLSGGYTGRIQVWEVGPGGTVSEAQRFVGHSGAVQTITVGKDGSRVLSGGADKTLRCWTLNDGREQFAVDGFSGALKATFISQGGKQGLGCDGDVIVLVDMQEGKAIQSMKLGKRSAQTVAIAPDGSLVVVNDLYALAAWEIRNGTGRPLFQDREIQWYATFLPNSKYLLSGGSGKVNVWDVATQRKLYEFDTAGSSYVQTIACSPDNRHFAAIPDSSGQDLQVFRLPAEVAAP